MMHQLPPRAPVTLAGPARFRLHRRLRHLPAPVPSGEIVVAAPPRLAQAAAQGWPLLLPLLSGAGSLPLLLGSSGSGRRWLLLGTGASLLLSTAAGLGLRLLARRGVERARRRERARYLDHLDRVGAEVARVAQAQRAAARWLHPDLDWLLRLVAAGERVWDRSATDEDFLEVRVGIGEVPLAAPVRLDLGHDPLADHEPELLTRAEDLVERSTRLRELPLTVALRRAGVVAVHGPPGAARSLVRSMLLRAAVLQGPSDLAIVGLFPPDAAPAWEWLKWLPHAREAPVAGATPVPRCRVAAGSRRAAALLEQVVGARLGGGTSDGGEPHRLVVIDGYTPDGALGRLPAVAALLRTAPVAGVTVICLVGRAADEPSTTALRVELDGWGGVAVTGLAAAERRVRRGRADRADPAVSEAIARRLAPLRLAAPTDPDVEEVESGDAWLRAPIGQLLGASAGAPVLLDLKEAAAGGMGPHGLLVGATGSGKSELLRTLVAGLALTHPPELLSLVLVDFKGGAAFAGLAGLPHTAGLITNLQAEPRTVDRARAALRGELERRQRLLRDAGDLDSIEAYQRTRSADPTLEPLPRLLIVVDEFGELLAAHPEFLELFTAIGRTGRSLGIHLLLASQRLEAGRLRGLDSHLRYRICLRTFSPADSAAVLGAPDAYFLPPAPGHGLLKVDSDPHLRFKSLLVSGLSRATTVGPAAIAPEPPLVLPFDPLIEPARPGGSDGRSGRSVPGSDAHAAAGPPAAPGCGDLEAVVRAMAPIVRAGRRTHRIWLPPLAATIPLDQVVELGGAPRSPDHPDWLRVPVGIVDRPFEQSQEPLLLDFTGRSGHLAIAGAPRSGKSTLLATLIAGFALTHRPDEVQSYCVDLGGGLLHELAGLPHVGAVLGIREPGEVCRLVRDLLAILAEREEGFRRHGIDSMPGWHRRRAAAPLAERDRYGEVFLVIDNWSRFRQAFPDLEPEIEVLAGSGLHYGVHLVVAANRWADLRLALRDNIGGRLELRLNDPVESEIDRAAAARLPDRLPGRGLTPAGDEFQTAVPVWTTGSDDAAAPRHPAIAVRPIAGHDQPALQAPDPAHLRSIADHAVRSPTGAEAPPLHPLPGLIPLEALLAKPAEPTGPTGGPAGSAARPTGPIASGASWPGPRHALTSVPIGLYDHRLELVRLELGSAPHFLVFGDPESGKTAALRCVATALMAHHAPDELRIVLVDFRRGLAGLTGAAHCDAHASTTAAAAEAAERLRSILERRVPGSTGQSTAPGGRWGGDGPHHLLVIDDYDLVTATGHNPLDPLLELVALGRDVGLHVLLARPVNGTARGSFEPFYQRVRDSGGAGLILSGDPREGPLLGARTATPQPPGRGHLVTRHGRGGLVQVAWVPPDASLPTATDQTAPGHPGRGTPPPATWPARATSSFAAPGGPASDRATPTDVASGPP
jgi:S-DNA-T family DNA segregation ATPase FtsK/SpoIIIE